MATGQFGRPFTNDSLILNRMTNVRVSDLNSVASEIAINYNLGAYIVKFGSTTSHNPASGGGFCIGFAYTNNSEVQIACVAGTASLYIRAKSSGTWGNWATV